MKCAPCGPPSERSKWPILVGAVMFFAGLAVALIVGAVAKSCEKASTVPPEEVAPERPGG